MVLIIIILFIIIGIIVSFTKDLNKDHAILNAKPLDKRFTTLLEILNNVIYKGEGSVNVIDKRELSLYKKGENQIINIAYSTDILIIVWRFKWLQQEVSQTWRFRNAQQITDDAQERIATTIISEMSEIIENHIHKVIQKIP